MSDRAALLAAHFNEPINQATMNSRNTLLAILGGVALTTAMGILLAPYRKSSKRKKLIGKARGYKNAVEDSIKESAGRVKTKVKKMGNDAERMINEGG